MLRGVVQKRVDWRRTTAWPADATHRALGRARKHFDALPPGTVPATLRWSAAAVGIMVVAWYLASYPGALGEVPPLSPAASQEEQIGPSGCTVLELDRATNVTTRRPCPTSRPMALTGI
jgi:hypothetical protein